MYNASNPTIFRDSYTKIWHVIITIPLTWDKLKFFSESLKDGLDIVVYNL